MTSANPAFDAAAQKVGKLMRFSPAIGLNNKPVPVRLPQPIQFRPSRTEFRETKTRAGASFDPASRFK